MLHLHAFTDTFRAQGFVPLVKSADHRRIVSSADVFDFELDATEIEELDQRDECTFFVTPFLPPAPFMVNIIDKRVID